MPASPQTAGEQHQAQGWTRAYPDGKPDHGHLYRQTVYIVQYLDATNSGVLQSREFGVSSDEYLGESEHLVLLAILRGDTGASGPAWVMGGRLWDE